VAPAGVQSKIDDGFDDLVMHQLYLHAERYIPIVFGNAEPLGNLVNDKRVLGADKIVDSFTIDVFAVASSLNATTVSAGTAGDVNDDGDDDLMMTLEPDWWTNSLSQTYIFYGPEMLGLVSRCCPEWLFLAPPQPQCPAHIFRPWQGRVIS